MITIHDVQRTRSPRISPRSTIRPAQGLGCDRRQGRARHGARPVHAATRRMRQRRRRPLDEAQRERILAANDAMTQDALRVLGVAYRVVEDMPDG